MGGQHLSAKTAGRKKRGGWQRTELVHHDEQWPEASNDGPFLFTRKHESLLLQSYCHNKLWQFVIYMYLEAKKRVQKLGTTHTHTHTHTPSEHPPHLKYLLLSSLLEMGHTHFQTRINSAKDLKPPRGNKPKHKTIVFIPYSPLLLNNKKSAISLSTTWTHT